MNEDLNNVEGRRDFPRIIFMGTPEFAEASLAALINAGFNIVAVVTAADKPAGRGMKMTSSRVKQFAERQGLPILTPEKLKNPVFIEQLRSFQADLQVVVAFRMLPEVVWNMPPMGTLNLHGSLLPQYRGAAPINWAIINGEKETGITTFLLKHEIDTGDILLQQRLPISEDETAGELHDRMMAAGAELLVQTVSGLAENSLQETPQASLIDTLKSGTTLHHAPKIFTETCKIDWNKSADQVYNLIRGLSPYPGAFTEFQGKVLKIFKAKKIMRQTSHNAGEVDTDRKTYLSFAAQDGYISIDELQLEGKRRMAVLDFLRGLR